MLIEIALILVSGNVLKHTSILHVMAVQHVMQGRKICPIGIVQKNRARRALLPVQVTVQVIIIVLPLNHRIIDLSSRNLNPGNDVRILGILLFWLMRKLIRISHKSCRKIRIPLPYSAALHKYVSPGSI